MNTDEKMLLLHNYDLWCHLDDQEYEDLPVFIVASISPADYTACKKSCICLFL